MDYGRLGETEPHGIGASTRSLTDQSSTATSSSRSSRKCNLKMLLISASVLLLVSGGIVAGLALLGRARSKDPNIHRRPTQAISKACSLTRYPSLCIDSLLDFPGSLTASDQDMVHISVNVTLRRFGKATDMATEINNLPMDLRSRSAYDDCVELLEDSVELLARSLNSISPENLAGTGGYTTHDVMTWLSSSLTNQDTCEEGLSEMEYSNVIRDQMSYRLKDLSELASNALAIFAAGGDDFSGIPIKNRKLLKYDDVTRQQINNDEGFPTWLSERDRKLLTSDLSAQQAHIIVSKDGNGTYKTIAEAIKKVPERSQTRIVIYITAGRYEERILKVGRKKTNLMIIGEGKGKTVITGGKSIFDNITTFHTATFAATGAGFIAKDITFENYAGPEKHQAVALRIGADHSVIYRCSIIGYQDTLYVHSNRQFYRECDIYGTIDFIFGNAAVVLQNCGIYPRKPLPNQKNTITAQSRKDPNQNTGISIHTSKIEPTPDLKAAESSFQTYLGRPWKMYSRTVYMQCNMGDTINPQGWLAWNGTFALDTLYYGEYMNYGPGAGTAQRVNWSGYHQNMSRLDATKFTVGQFISGSTWLPSTGVAFVAGLQV